METIKRHIEILNKKEKRKLLTLTSLRSLISLLDSLGIILIGVIVSFGTTLAAQNQTQNSTQSGILDIVSIDKSNFQLFVLITMIFFVVKSIAGYLLLRSTASTCARIETRISRHLFEDIFYASVSKFSLWTKSELRYGTSISSSYATTGMYLVMITIVTEISLLITILITFMIVDLAMTIGIVIYFLMVAVLIHQIVGKKYHEAGLRLRESTLETNEMTDRSFDAFREIFVLKKQQYFSDQYSTPRFEMAKYGAIASYLGAVPRYILESALLIGTIVLIAATFQADDLGKSAGILGVFLAGSFRIMGSMIPLLNALGSFRQISAQSESYFVLRNEYERMKPEVESISGHESHNRAPLGVKVENLSYQYDMASEFQLNIPSLRVEAGSIVAIVGPSGSGKSTLADIILGLAKPTIGHVTFFSGDGLSERPSPGDLAYVPQKLGFTGKTIVDNVAFGIDDLLVDRTRVGIAIEEAQLEKTVDSLAFGVESNIGQQLDSLSGGQMQRLGIARALYAHSRLLILDEATSSLDADSEALITQVVHNLKNKTTVIVIAHRLSTIKDADNIFVMDGGNVVAQGTFAELSTSNDLFRRYIAIMDVSE